MKIDKNRPVKLVDGMDDMDIVRWLLVGNDKEAAPLKTFNGPRGRLGLFSRYGALTRVEEVGGDTRGEPRLVGPEPINHAQLKALLESKQAFGKTAPRAGVQPWNLNRGVLDNLMSLAEWDYNCIPEVVGATEWVTARRDGSLVTDAGYDPATKVYVRMDNSVWQGVQETLEEPPPEHVAAAKNWLLDDLLGDFEFETQADRANALAMIITGAMRHAFDGLVPLVLIDATMASSGKGTLAEVFARMFGMDEPELRAFAKDDEELNKQIVSVLRSSAKPFIVWDNVERSVDGEALAVLLTTKLFAGRVLGTSEDFRGLNDRVWAVTGNNLKLGKDIRRRSIRIRQAPKHDPREGRKKFRHPNLFRWMEENKTKLSKAVATLIRAWAVAGCPSMENQDSVRRLSSYQNWANTVGGVLDVVGVEGFLDNVVSLQYDDEATDELKEMVVSLESHFQGSRFTPQEAASYFNSNTESAEALPDWMRGKGPFVEVRARQMKKWLQSVRGRMCGVGEMRLEDASGEKGTHFTIVGREAHSDSDFTNLVKYSM